MMTIAFSYDIILFRIWGMYVDPNSIVMESGCKLVYAHILIYIKCIVCKHILTDKHVSIIHLFTYSFLYIFEDIHIMVLINPVIRPCI